ncbi:TetR family transcriptional regulator [Paenibacillus sp. FSL R7-0273]|uniref:TetR/AcrR family transcriptional regulator n=1 Tax=Paenibacillus sp. FSL R7-0273 TaxID=1536772 RepID=UPI0004F64B1F|nr:TetR/AcrR family transcriptional regulator [Paenibacillus sp. FSL R7-0273]AIQ47995.1 TetR family transcriptional regulator [Paenibacillus sp. FSL R7-0273]OMF94456.1 TetR family transcriptional regulator [Paenibacillus sp. FSL R7-0273]
MDRRVRKSQEAIMEALISLMAEKEFEKITINEIAERADINRGTVYAHYTDKYHLLDLCIETHLDQLIASCMPLEGNNEPPYPTKDSLLRVFTMLEKHTAFYTTLLTSKGVPALRSRLLEMICLGIRQQFTEEQFPAGVDQEVRIQFMASATVGVIEWWFTNPLPYSAEDITGQLWAMLEQNQMLPGKQLV